MRQDELLQADQSAALLSMFKSALQCLLQQTHESGEAVNVSMCVE